MYASVTDFPPTYFIFTAEYTLYTDKYRLDVFTRLSRSNENQFYLHFFLFSTQTIIFSLFSIGFGHNIVYSKQRTIQRSFSMASKFIKNHQ